MDDLPTSSTPPSPALAGRVRRRTWLVAAAVAAGVLAVGGGVAGAVAAAVSHGSATPSPGGATLYFPAVGQPGGGVSSGGGGAGVGAPMPAIAGGGMATTQGLAAPAMSYAPSGSSYVYPSPVCGTPEAPQVQGDGITATGIVQVPLGSPTGQAITSSLNVGVQSNGDTDVRSALSDVRQKLAAVRDAVRRAGVSDSDISDQNLGVWANGGPRVVSSNVNGGLTVTIRDTALIDRVIDAAVGAGATSLNLWSSNGNTAASPSDDQVRTALAKAAGEARGMAEAEAKGAGLSLGSARGVSAQPPAVCPWAPGGPQLVVAVTVTYAVK